MKLSGYNTLITGGTQGLGRRIVETFLAEGANVVFCARTAADVDGTQAALAPRPCGQQLAGIGCDITDPAGVAGLFAHVARWGSLHAVVNNAGILGPIGPSAEIALADWMQTWQVNVTGTLLVCQQAVRAMRPGGGKIINLSGGGATAPMPRLAAYAASKAAVVRLTETLAEEYRADHIAVNAVAPGAMHTRLTGQVLAAGPERAGADLHARNRKCAEGEAVDPALGAALCVFLASAESDGITGKLISAQWDPWQNPREFRAGLQGDVYTLRRIVPADRGEVHPVRSAGLQFALIGCGVVGRKRAAGLPAGALRYACDSDAGRAAELAQAQAGATALTDYRQALADPAVGAVIIATPNASLAPIALAAVCAGKPVLVEKPGALNAAQLRAVQAAADRAGVPVRLGYNHRFHPAIRQARTLVDSGALGPLMFLRGRYGHGGRLGYEREWRADPGIAGGGELIDQGVHLIDLARWFLGDFTELAGHVTTCFWPMPVDDNAFLSLRTAGGQTAWLHASCTEWKNLFSLELYGARGKVAIDGLGGSYGPERCTFYRMRPEMGPPETTAWDYPTEDGSWARELAAFTEDIRTGGEPNPGLREGIRILEIVESIYRSSGYPVSTASL